MRIFCIFKVLCPMWISSAESHLGLLDSVVRSAETCDLEYCCLEHRRKVLALLGLVFAIQSPIYLRH